MPDVQVLFPGWRLAFATLTSLCALNEWSENETCWLGMVQGCFPGEDREDGSHRGCRGASACGRQEEGSVRRRRSIATYRRDLSESHLVLETCLV